MTYDEMIEAINAPSPADKLDVAERALAAYQGDDRDLIEPAIMEMAALNQSL